MGSKESNHQIIIYDPNVQVFLKLKGVSFMCGLGFWTHLNILKQPKKVGYSTATCWCQATHLDKFDKIKNIFETTT